MSNFTIWGKGVIPTSHHTQKRNYRQNKDLNVENQTLESNLVFLGLEEIFAGPHTC
jgi:hypothetical protein